MQKKMKKLKLKKGAKIIIGITVFILALVLFIVSLYFYLLTPVDKNNTKTIYFTVKKGDRTKEIIDNLKKANLIRNKEVAYVYSFFNKDLVFKVGTFSLKQSMGTRKILKTLDSGHTKEQDGVNITFEEGKRYTDYIEKINKTFGIDSNEFASLMNDDNYLQGLIDDYWFLTDDILNKEIYYPLEGYLFPDTYNFMADVKPQEIIKKILDNTDKKLSQYQNDFTKNEDSIHNLMTLASIVELEGKNGSDRAGIAGVFINRLNNNMSLGSDVTTYYGAKKTFKENLSVNELQECNAYNTRSSCLATLPVGPVSNPGIDAIEAALKPEKNDYLFFVSDKDGKIYFSKTGAEHEKQVASLKQSGNWYIYE